MWGLIPAGNVRGNENDERENIKNIIAKVFMDMMAFEDIPRIFWALLQVAPHAGAWIEILKDNAPLNTFNTGIPLEMKPFLSLSSCRNHF